MGRPQQIANRIREVILHGTWIANTNYQDQLSRVTWQESIRKISDLNTMAALTYHINYYIAGVLNVLEGGGLDIHDKYSFDLPPIASQEEWDTLRTSLFENAAKFADKVEALTEQQLDSTFVDEKYGTYERNIEAIIEHSYYHLGQISLIRKLMLEEQN